MKKAAFTRILCTVLVLTLVLPLMPAALAEDASVFDNRDLGPDYANCTTRPTR